MMVAVDWLPRLALYEGVITDSPAVAISEPDLAKNTAAAFGRFVNGVLNRPCPGIGKASVQKVKILGG